jgi:hypothetical protein
VDQDARCADVHNKIPLPRLPAPHEQYNNRSFTCPYPRKYGGGGAIEGYWNVFIGVEINQCVGCTRQFFIKSFRWRAGVASTAWRSTRLFRTNEL